MSNVGIIISVTAALVGLVWVIFPLLGGRSNTEAASIVQQKQREALPVRYEQVLRTIRDLDEDQAMGKLAPGIYEETREGWVQTGTQILQALDDMPPIEAHALSDEALDERIEAEIARYLTAKAGQA